MQISIGYLQIWPREGVGKICLISDAGLWDVKARPPPKAKWASVTIYFDDSESQILFPDSFYAYPDYPMDSYLS
jgi:hypothetical protein